MAYICRRESRAERTSEKGKKSDGERVKMSRKVLDMQEIARICGKRRNLTNITAIMLNRPEF